MYLRGRHNDWAVTALFYAALHYVDMYFVAHGPPYSFPAHSKRNQAIQNQLTPIWMDYRVLLDESRYARYDGASYTDQDVDDFRRNELERIKAHLRQRGIRIP